MYRSARAITPPEPGVEPVSVSGDTLASAETSVFGTRTGFAGVTPESSRNRKQLSQYSLDPTTRRPTFGRAALTRDSGLILAQRAPVQTRPSIASDRMTSACSSHRPTK